MTRLTQIKDYLTRMPKEPAPAGRAFVHNRVMPVARMNGTRGSRFWLEAEGEEHREVCRCRWAPLAGTHYRPKRAP